MLKPPLSDKLVEAWWIRQSGSRPSLRTALWGGGPPAPATCAGRRVRKRQLRPGLKGRSPRSSAAGLNAPDGSVRGSPQATTQWTTLRCCQGVPSVDELLAHRRQAPPTRTFRRRHLGPRSFGALEGDGREAEDQVRGACGRQLAERGVGPAVPERSTLRRFLRRGPRGVKERQASSPAPTWLRRQGRGRGGDRHSENEP